MANNNYSGSSRARGDFKTDSPKNLRDRGRVLGERDDPVRFGDSSVGEAERETRMTIRRNAGGYGPKGGDPQLYW
jgi:hypothetical protein